MRARRCLVCGVDGSDGSFRPGAAAVALELADHLDAETVFVHVLAPHAPRELADSPARPAPKTHS